MHASSRFDTEIRELQIYMLTRQTTSGADGAHARPPACQDLVHIGLQSAEPVLTCLHCQGPEWFFSSPANLPETLSIA